MTAASEPTGTLQVAMAHATRLLKVDPTLAAEQALEILKALPNHPAALVLLATARRRASDPESRPRVSRPHPPANDRSRTLVSMARIDVQ